MDQASAHISLAAQLPQDDETMHILGIQPALEAVFQAFAGLRPVLLYSHITLGVPMHTTNLRKVGGSVMLAVPPALLDLLKLKAGASVDIGIEEGRLIVAPRPRPSYTLDELLAQCDGNAAADDTDRAWLDAKPVGNELL